MCHCRQLKQVKQVAILVTYIYLLQMNPAPTAPGSAAGPKRAQVTLSLSQNGLGLVHARTVSYPTSPAGSKC